MPETLYQKILNRHIVCEDKRGLLLYIDRHFVHEVTSPQAFEGMRLNNIDLWRTNSIVAVPDHNVPTTEHRDKITDNISRLQLESLDANCREFGVAKIEMQDVRQGIVHVIGPEQGATLPGMTIVCGDSHTSTHGAFGCLAFGIGTTEIEHVMATQSLVVQRAKTFKVQVDGQLRAGVEAKDIILNLIRQIGTAGGSGYVFEYAGSCIESLSMAERMTICNMSIEAGARAGMVAVDDKTLSYLQNRPLAPKGEQWEKAVQYWQTLKSDAGAVFDKTLHMQAESIKPQISWGTSPEMVISIDESVPDPVQEPDPIRRSNMENALLYMGLTPNTPITQVPLDQIFIGSCTNARIEDLRTAAQVVKGKTIAPNIKRALVVPGSGLVRQQAEQEGLDQIFTAAGFEWRQAGCSMCLGMNEDKMGEYERCASTSNRNFEGRQGYKSRTHLVSPTMAAAAAVNGYFVDITN